MDEILKLYSDGATYREYVETAEITDKEKHLYYFNKMQLTQNEKKLVLGVVKSVRLLVFCNTACNDCRISLAVLENIRLSNPKIDFRIVSREGNLDIMQNFDTTTKIPMIIKIEDDNLKLIFNEFSELLSEKMKKLSPEETDILRQSYRKGAYKEEMLNQLIELMAK